jgi:hypothetical protein
MIGIKNSRLSFFLAGALLLLFDSPRSRADSFYSSIGLGIPRYYVSPKAVGMGGAGIGVVDRLALNAMNPAAINVAGITTLAIDLEYESIDTKNEFAKVNTRQGNASGFRFVMPLAKNIGALFILKPLAGSRYNLSILQTTDGAEYTRNVKGDGGLNAASIGLQYQIKWWLAVGMLADFHFGSYNEQWKTDFTDNSYTDATDYFSSHMLGGGFVLGTLVRPRPNLGLGMVYQYNGSLDGETQTVLGGFYGLGTTSFDISYPSAISVGVSYNIPKFLFALDYSSQFWSKYEVKGVRLQGLQDSWRIGGGMEFLSSNTYLSSFSSRISWRLGGYYAQLPFPDLDGKAIDERFLSLGVGLPFHANSGRVDLSFEVGRRGQLSSAVYEDTIFRFSGSITGSELWFQRSH